MAHGFTGKVLRVDLSARSIKVEEPGEAILRRYLSGGRGVVRLK